MASQPVTLPTLDEYERAEQKVYLGFDECEELLLRVSEVTAVLDGPRPTVADLGALWMFGDAVRLHALSFAEFARRAEALLPELDDLRIRVEPADGEAADDA